MISPSEPTPSRGVGVPDAGEVPATADSASEVGVRAGQVRPGEWVPACRLDDLVCGRGVGVLGPDDAQAALFRVPAAETDREAVARTRVYAIGNIDPFARAAVISRGLTGDRAGEPTVASPIGKQVFSLRTGACLDDESVTLPAYAARVTGGTVEVYFPTDAHPSGSVPDSVARVTTAAGADRGVQ
ncbi:hypothetical protein GCM10009624_04890 [Gordonia sinesedis]